MNIIRKKYHKLLHLKDLKIYSKLLRLPQKPNNSKKILDVGCSSGRDLIKKFKDGYDCYGFDTDKKTILDASKFFKKNNIKCKFVCSNGMNIPFRNETFDEILCNNVIEHVEDDEKCIKEIYRTLKRNGRLQMFVPDKRNLYTVFHQKLGFKNYYTDKTHFKEYNKNEISEKLGKSGFKILNLRLTGFFPPFGLKLCHFIDAWLPVFSFLNLFNYIIENHNSQIEIIASK